MRLTDHEHSAIAAVLKRHFGDDAVIWLFGSRVDDSARGGDIDLLVETTLNDPDEIVEAKLAALVELYQRIGEQKIDLVIQRPHGVSLPIHRIAHETGVTL
ncbi:nucleotidyltransferase domain-containing protein [Halomonas alkalicola]|uniref:nucleotidyltransferase domain-containing protein n=1 Tax=Halomonas alkalicola TaxID=1930622 RepID=UPI00265DBC03|nr:nucleotidyltransferase domain-containing protein [Halomonas alkalicola]